MVGVVTISMELELGWGMHDLGVYNHLSADRSIETATLHRLLNLCDHHGIQISFDIVGHLLQESCRGHHDGPYPDGWWDEDPGSDADSDPLFYAPDLITAIQNRPTDHEICTHTYSHILADNSSGEIIEHELSLLKETHSEFGLSPPTSIVMPRHRKVESEILHRHGIETIRRPISDYGARFSNPVGSFFSILTRKHPICDLQLRDGLVETTCTPHPSLSGTFLPAGRRNPHPMFSLLPKRLRMRRHRSYLKDAIDTAARQDEHIHLWSHLYNVANDQQIVPTEDAFEYLGNRIQEGEIIIRRMCDLSETVT